jgi:hypothetical protein
MNRLRIIVDPDRGAPRKLHHDLELSDEQRATISRGNFGEYDLLYEIDGNIFGYYPSNLLAVLDDIARVLVNINNNQSHFITRAGYTILYARVFGDNIYLFDPLDESENWPKENYGDSLLNTLNFTPPAPAPPEPPCVALRRGMAWRGAVRRARCA